MNNRPSLSSPPHAPEDSAAVLSLGERVKALRLARGQSLGDVAQATDLSKGGLSRLESGLQTNPELKTLILLGRHFGVKVGYLLGEADSDAATVFGQQIDGLSPRQQQTVLGLCQMFIRQNQEDSGA